MTKRGEKQNEGWKKEKKERTWGIAPVIWEECTRGHILNSTAVAWLMLNSLTLFFPPLCEKLPILLNTSLVQEITYKCAIHWKTAEAEDKEAGVA